MSETVCGLDTSESTICNVPARVPVAVGVNTTEIMPLVPELSEPRQLFDWL